jgi:hypothetical protein
MMKNICFLAACLLFFQTGVFAGDQRDPREDKAIAVVMSNPQVMDHTTYLIERGGVPTFRIENEKDGWDKGMFDVYSGEDTGDMTHRFGSYTFDWNKRLLTSAPLEGGEDIAAEYNKLLFSKITVDSSYRGYKAAALLDYTQTQKGAKAREIAWASTETSKDHWIRAAFDKKTTLHKVMLYWAWDKGKFYKSEKIQLSYLGPAGREVLIEKPQETNHVLTDENLKTQDCDLRQTCWTFPAITTTRLTIRQISGGGNIKRSNLMWVHKVWAY